MTSSSQDFLAFSRPTIEAGEIQEVVDSLQSGWITTGPKVLRFEAMFRDYLGVNEAVAVSSATAAWHLLVHALDIGPGDEVIVPAISWPSIANMVELAGARAVFADVQPDTLQIDPKDLGRCITPRTRAVVPVHFAGAPCDMDAIVAQIGARPIVVVEDAAHALGTEYRGRQIGSTGNITLYSFHAIKNITTGEGGMLTCNDAALAQRLRLLRFHGITRDTWARSTGGTTADFELLEPGYKYNMLDLQAAIGLHQLPKLERFNRRRTELAARYDQLLRTIPGVTPLAMVPYPFKHAHHLYVVRLDTDIVGMSRDEFVSALGHHHIGTGLHFPATHLKKYYRERYGYTRSNCPVASQAGDCIVSLPLYPNLGESDVDRVVQAICAVIGHECAF